MHLQAQARPAVSRGLKGYINHANMATCNISSIASTVVQLLHKHSQHVRSHLATWQPSSTAPQKWSAQHCVSQLDLDASIQLIPLQFELSGVFLYATNAQCSAGDTVSYRCSISTGVMMPAHCSFSVAQAATYADCQNMETLPVLFLMHHSCLCLLSPFIESGVLGSC